MVWHHTRKSKAPPGLARAVRRRHSDERVPESTSVRLIRKHAEMIDGVNLENAAVGDRLELPKRDADVLIAEGWAERTADERRVRLLPGRALAADHTRGSRKKPRT
jgi:hypothetical protein